MKMTAATLLWLSSLAMLDPNVLTPTQAFSTTARFASTRSMPTTTSPSFGGPSSSDGTTSLVQRRQRQMHHPLTASTVSSLEGSTTRKGPLMKRGWKRLRSILPSNNKVSSSSSLQEPSSKQQQQPSQETLAKIPSLNKILAFSSTTILIWLSEPLLSLVDTTVVGMSQGGTSVLQLASMGPATTLMDTLLYMTYFLAISTTSLISQGLAEERWRDLQQTVSHLLGAAALLGLGVTALVWCPWTGPAMLKAMAGATCTPELLQYAVSYAKIRAAVAPAAVMGMVAQSFCLANLNTAAPVLAVVAASVVNVVGDLALRSHGVVGAAAATAAATTASSLLLLRAVRNKVRTWRAQELSEWNNDMMQQQKQQEEERRARAEELLKAELEAQLLAEAQATTTTTTTESSSITLDETTQPLIVPQDLSAGILANVAAATSTTTEGPAFVFSSEPVVLPEDVATLPLGEEPAASSSTFTFNSETVMVPEDVVASTTNTEGSTFAFNSEPIVVPEDVASACLAPMSETPAAAVETTPTVLFIGDESDELAVATMDPTPAITELATPTTDALQEEAPRQVPFFSLPNRQALMSLASISGPLCFNMWIKMFSYMMLTLRTAAFGVVPLAAHNVLMRLFFFFGCFADALGMSAQAFLPPALYPRDEHAVRGILKRLTVVAVATAALIGASSAALLHSPAGYWLAARDWTMRHTMSGQAWALGAALFLHPLIVLTEGTVIATRDFGNLIKTYAASVVLHAAVLSQTTSFAGIWRAMCLFQLSRLVNYRIWKSRKPQPSEEESSESSSSMLESTQAQVVTDTAAWS